ncbi:MAG: hypothetical protein Q4D38_07855 [Planctomycetia bacterium]|nr:hypothetical protein [Planctomycetia bacterium]
MGLGDMIRQLFPTEADKKKARTKQQRRCISTLERLGGSIDEMVQRYKTNSDRAWQEARAAMQSGNKMRAKMCIQRYRAYQSRLYAFERRRYVFQNYLDNLKNMIQDNEISESLAVAGKIINVDVDKILGSMGTIQDKIDQCDELGREYDRLYGADMNSISGADAEYLPDMDNMMKRLEMEVAGDIQGGNSHPAANPELDQLGGDLERLFKQG